MKHAPWKIEASSSVLDTPWLKVRADACTTPSGERIDPYYVVESEDWVHTAVFDEQRRILLIRLYRHGNQAVNLEIPGGNMDPGDPNPETAARRELLEETGYTADQFIPLGDLTPNSARNTNSLHGFAVLGPRKVAEPATDAAEEISCEWVELPELMRRITAGEFRQALHLAVIFLALQKLGWLDLDTAQGRTSTV